MFGIDRFNLNCYLQVGFCVDSLIDLPKSPLVNLPNNFEVLAHLLQHLRHRKNNYCLKKLTNLLNQLFKITNSDYHFKQPIFTHQA